MTDAARNAATVETVDPADGARFQEWADVLRAVFLLPGTATSNLQHRVAGHRLTTVRDRGRAVATFRSFDTDLTLPASDRRAAIPVSAITNVSVLPTHKRRGLLTCLVDAELQRCRTAGTPVAILISSEAPIYGRFGFGVATEACSWTIDTTAARVAHPIPGRTELVDANRFLEEAPRTYELARWKHPGSIGRSSSYWSQLADDNSSGTGAPYFAIHRDANDQTDGFIAYRAGPTPDLSRVKSATATITDLFAASQAAYAALWQHCASLDFVRTVVAPNRSTGELLPWLLEDRRAASSGPAIDLLWARILDPAAALSARDYMAPGHLALRIRDAGGPAEGRFVLQVSEDGSVDCFSDTSRDAWDLEMPVASLSSLWLGLASPVLLERAGRLRAESARSLWLAQRMFSWWTPPWSGCWF